MPRTVDHEERRATLAEALINVAARDGLHAVSMRSVAAEAGVSLRLVQYYFETKGQLMHWALLYLERKSHNRWTERLSLLPSPPPPRAFIEAFFAEALPDDDESRTFHLVWTSFAVLAMTDPDLAAQPFVEGPDRLERQLADVLRQAQQSGELVAGIDAPTEAARLLALSHGLGTSVLVGQRSAQSAAAVMRYHLDRLFDGTGADAPR